MYSQCCNISHQIFNQSQFSSALEGENWILSLFLLTSVTYVGLIITLVRFKHIRYLYTDSVANVECLNKFSTVLGVLSFIGMLIVASFQVCMCVHVCVCVCGFSGVRDVVGGWGGGGGR